MLFYPKSAIFAAYKMKLRDLEYRTWTYIRHVLTAWNTGGEGIHSPYLFYLVRFLFYDDNTYYIYKDIEYRRSCMLRAPKVIRTEDYGTGHYCERSVMEIAKTSLECPKVGQLFFRLIHYLSREAGRPLQIAELGTSLGITTAYLAAPYSRNHVWSYEGAHEIAQLAKKNWEALGLHNIHLVEGNIDETLSVSSARGQNAIPYWDFVFIDANHTYEATKRYVMHFIPLLNEKSIIALDDIHYSAEMERAWQEMKALPEVTTSMDLYHVGLLFFDKHYIHRHYKLRL